MLESCSN